MSEAQLTAFEAGSGVTANTLLLGIAASVLVLAFVWVLWITFGSFKAWQAGNAVLFDVAWSVIRASIVLMVLGFYLN